jgi:hypothetical protein
LCTNVITSTDLAISAMSMYAVSVNIRLRKSLSQIYTSLASLLSEFLVHSCIKIRQRNQTLENAMHL